MYNFDFKLDGNKIVVGESYGSGQEILNEYFDKHHLNSTDYSDDQIHDLIDDVAFMLDAEKGFETIQMMLCEEELVEELDLISDMKELENLDGFEAFKKLYQMYVKYTKPCFYIKEEENIRMIYERCKELGDWYEIEKEGWLYRLGMVIDCYETVMLNDEKTMIEAGKDSVARGISDDLFYFVKKYGIEKGEEE